MIKIPENCKILCMCSHMGFKKIKKSINNKILLYYALISKESYLVFSKFFFF